MLSRNIGIFTVKESGLALEQSGDPGGRRETGEII
jgi:hypothetical protein